MNTNKEILKITQEITQAYEEKSKGKDGLARVCARRAVGWAIKKHLELQGVLLETPSVMNHISYMLNQPNINPEVQKILIHMLQKVEKGSVESGNFWPLQDVDLAEEAHWFVENLLGICIDIGESKFI